MSAMPHCRPAPGGQAGTARLLVTCQDRSGIVAAVSGFLHRRGVNIIHSDQHSTDPEGGRFFMRQEFYYSGLEGCLDELVADFGREVAGEYANATQDEGWSEVARSIAASEKLLWALLAGDALDCSGNALNVLLCHLFRHGLRLALPP